MSRTSAAIAILVLMFAACLLALGTFPWQPPQVILMFGDQVHVTRVLVTDGVCYVRSKPTAEWTALQPEGKIEYAGQTGAWTLYTGGGKLDPQFSATWFAANCNGAPAEG